MKTDLIRCKKCNEIIAIGFPGLIKGIEPVEVTIKSLEKDLCKKCFEGEN